MNNMKNVKISSKLLMAFTLVIVLSLILGITGWVMISMVSAKGTEIYDTHLLGVKQISDAEISYEYMRIATNKIAVATLSGYADELEEQKQTFYTNQKDFDNDLQEFSNMTLSKEIIAQLDEFHAMEPGYLQTADELIKLCSDTVSKDRNILTDDDISAVNTALSATAAKAGDIEKKLDDMKLSKSNDAKAASDDTNFLTLVATIIQIGMLVLIIVFSIIIAMFISKGIEKDLKKIIQKLNDSSKIINSSVVQLSETSESLASGSSRQAAAIEETSATMNETASMVAQNAENTRLAAQIATDATDMANKGMREMKEMVRAMDELKESSDRVGKIVKTIDDIAFQTNLLAINATVEAARAGGDAGRSFSVVAEEVRSLAQKSSTAVSDTTQIIEKNISLTNSGMNVSRNVSESLNEITEKTEQLNKLISEINAASEEQASGIKQINIAVSQMEKVTQENAAAAEENAASSNSMKDEINSLGDAVTIAQGIIRDADSVKEYVEKEKDSRDIRTTRSASVSKPNKSINYSTGSNNSTGINNLNRSPASVSGAASNPNANANRTPKKAMSFSTKTDAERIIPLDDNDDF